MGVDIYKPIKSSSEGNNLNYEIVGDLQITENLYLAAEYGLIDRLIEDENINFAMAFTFHWWIYLIQSCTAFYFLKKDRINVTKIWADLVQTRSNSSP